MSEVKKVKTLIIGTGPAGYTAAIYAARADIKPVMYTGMQPGGQLTITTEVDNYPGFPKGITGPDLMERMKQQAERFGTEIVFGEITDVDLSVYPFKLKADQTQEIEAEAIVIATGASAKWLGIKSEERLNGHGVSACATCDGFFYKGLDVAVIGGGDTAVEEATYLANLCKKVYLVVRRDELRASKAMQKRAFDTPNLEILFNRNPKEVIGEKEVEGLLLYNNKEDKNEKIDIQGMFVAIGHKPNTEIFKGQLEMDEVGYLKTKKGSTCTNVEGVFAAGDVQDNLYRQAVTAAGTGAMAAKDVEMFLAQRK